MLYTLLVFIIGTCLLLKKFACCFGFQKKRLLLLTLSFSFPLIAALLFILGLDKLLFLDFTPLGFAITATMISVLLLKSKVFDLITTGEETVIRTIPDPFVITDSGWKLIDFNNRFRETFFVPDQNPAELNLMQIIPQLQFLENQDFYRCEIDFDIAESRHFEIMLQTIQSSTGRGKMVLFYDISERKKNELRQKELLKNLLQAKQKISELQNFLHICQQCGKIQDSNGNWQKIEKFILTYQKRPITHCCCPDCARQISAELKKNR